jgi:membrane fusion protein, heavy metal efflux system
MSENNLEEKEIIETEVVGNSPGKKSWLITAAIIGLIGLLGVGWIVAKQFSVKGETASEEKKEGEHNEGEGKEVKLEPELLASANIESEGVTARPAVSLLNVTGTIESNPQNIQVVTSLVSGRIERVNYSIGERVSAGEVVAVISSPQVAQIHGKMHEAETKYEIAERNLSRVMKSENRVSVLQAKARFDEASGNLQRAKDMSSLNSNKDVLTAETNFASTKARFDQANANFVRQKRIFELGATSQKALEEAETAYKTAKAEYEFQTNISLNKEIQEAKADVETAKVDLSHIRDEMRSLGIVVDEHSLENHQKNSSEVSITAPASGIVSERTLNNGSGVDANQAILTISNTSSVWITANVPENQLRVIRVGTVAEVKTATLGEGSITARVTNIDTTLNEDTRTAKVRLAVDNPGERLKAGMFAEIGFRAGTASGEEIVVKSNAVQRIDGKDVVFIPKKEETGAFEIREVETDGDIDGYTRIKKGLEMGESVVTKGSFTLKTQVEKGSMSDEH